MSGHAPHEALSELTILRARVAQLERRGRRPRLARRLIPIALAALLVALVPLATFAANPFTDLVPGSPHNGDIDLIYNAGITKGCDPPTFVNYCPEGFVTRQEMASFLARTAGLGSNAPVANAKTAQAATNAEQLGGVPANAYALKSDIGGGGSTGPTTRWYSFLGLLGGPNVGYNPGANNGSPVVTPPHAVVNVTDMYDLLLPLDYPGTVSGVPSKVSAIQVCYATPSGVNGPAIDRTSLVMSDQGQGSQVLLDTTTRQSPTLACYELTAPTPVAVSGALHLRVRVNALNFSSGLIRLYSARMTLVP